MKVVLRKRPNLIPIKENIANISSFCDVYAIFDEYCSKDELDAMSEDYKDFLKSVNDFDPIAFYVINRKIIVQTDSFNGEVLGVQTLAEFFKDSYKYYKEEYCEE